MKNATATMLQTTDIRSVRRHSRRNQRVIAANFREAARRCDTGPIRLVKATKIRPHRMLLAWLGLNIMVPDIFRLMTALGMDVSDVFRGTTNGY